MMTTCQKCGGMMVHEIGLSTEDRRGAQYHYDRCVICSRVIHYRNPYEMDSGHLPRAGRAMTLYKTGKAA